MLVKAPSDPDWFIIKDDEIVKRLALVPGLRLRRGQWQIHLSHLPLLTDVIEAHRLTPNITTDLDRNHSRDARFAGRFVLRPHQHTAVDFILARKGTLLADEPRVGKTTAALVAHDPRSGPLLVVCPLIVRDVWLTWIAKVFPGQDVGILIGKVFDPEPAMRPIVVCHYDILRYWQVNRRYGTLILDECHALSNDNSWRTRAATFLAAYSERTIALTGTPIWNRPSGLLPILGLVASAGFGSRYAFRERYCDPRPTAYGTRYEGASNEDELRQRLSTVMLRRLWKDVSSDLPPITRDLAIAEVTLAQARAIDLAVAEITGGTAASLARFRRAVGAVKLGPTIEMARTILERGEPLVIWTWHRDLARKIAEGLAEFGSFLVTGDTAQSRRAAQFDGWRKGPHALVLTLALGQVGIDLSHAHIALFAEIDYTPALMAQAEMRTYAPTRSMHLTYVTADHLIERRIVAALHDKLGSARPLGVDVASDAIDILQTAFNDGSQSADMERLARDLLSVDFTSG